MALAENDNRRRAPLNWPIIISVVSLVLSGWVAYTSILSAPNVLLSFNDPIWIRVAAPSTTASSKSVDTNGLVDMVATCSLTNTGARTGVVEDILLRLRSEDGSDKWLFFPFLQIDNSKIVSTAASPGAGSSEVGVSLPNALGGPFYPVAVSGKQSVAFTYLFQPVRDQEKFTYTKLTPHVYEITLLSRMAGEVTYREGKKITVKMLSRSIDIINSQGTLQIESEEAHKARGSLNAEMNYWESLPDWGKGAIFGALLTAFVTVLIPGTLSRLIKKRQERIDRAVLDFLGNLAPGDKKTVAEISISASMNRKKIDASLERLSESKSVENDGQGRWWKVVRYKTN